MKTTRTLFTALICSFVFGLTAPSSIFFDDHLVFSSDIYAASADTAPPEISPASHDIIWRYRTVNGVLYRRKYNQTTGQWIGKWIKL